MTVAKGAALDVRVGVNVVDVENTVVDPSLLVVVSTVSEMATLVTEIKLVGAADATVPAPGVVSGVIVTTVSVGLSTVGLFVSVVIVMKLPGSVEGKIVGVSEVVIVIKSSGFALSAETPPPPFVVVVVLGSGVSTVRNDVFAALAVTSKEVVGVGVGVAIVTKESGIVFSGSFGAADSACVVVCCEVATSVSVRMLNPGLGVDSCLLARSASSFWSGRNPVRKSVSNNATHTSTKTRVVVSHGVLAVKGA